MPEPKLHKTFSALTQPPGSGADRPANESPQYWMVKAVTGTAQGTGRPKAGSFKRSSLEEAQGKLRQGSDV